MGVEQRTVRPIVFHWLPGPARAPPHARAQFERGCLGQACRERALGTTLDCLGVQGCGVTFPRSRVKFDQGDHIRGGTLLGYARRPAMETEQSEC